LKALLGLLPTRAQAASLNSLFADWTNLHWASLPVIDRRWTVPLAATAVAMGLFIGVAIGPGIRSTVGAAQQAIQMPATEDAGGAEAGAATADAGPPVLQAPVENTTSSASTASSTPTSTEPVLTSPPPAPTTTTTTEAPPTTTTTTPETTPPPVLPPEEPEEVVFKGTVMHVNEAAGSYVLTTGKGQMNAIHAKQLPAPGAQLEVPVRELANHTYAEDGKEDAAGSARQIKFQGLVTYSDPARGGYTVSRKGASVFVHPDPATQPSGAPPGVGAQVTVTAKLTEAPDEDDTAGGPPTGEQPPATEPPTAGPAQPPATIEPPASGSAKQAADCGTPPDPPEPAATILVEVSHTVDIEFLGYSDFEGIVQGVCDDGSLLLSADDLRESAADLTMMPGADTGIDFDPIEPGDVVDASAVIDEETGELQLTGISSDAQIRGADDADLAQGDQAG
jgi:hypothetical protein